MIKPSGVYAGKEDKVKCGMEAVKYKFKEEYTYENSTQYGSSQH